MTPRHHPGGAQVDVDIDQVVVERHEDQRQLDPAADQQLFDHFDDAWRIDERQPLGIAVEQALEQVAADIATVDPTVVRQVVEIVDLAADLGAAIRIQQSRDERNS